MSGIVIVTTTVSVSIRVEMKPLCLPVLFSEARRDSCARPRVGGTPAQACVPLRLSVRSKDGDKVVTVVCVEEGVQVRVAAIALLT